MKTLSDLYRLFPTRPAPVAVPALPAANQAPAPLEACDGPNRPDRYRRRDFGTGYGRSSGYAQDRSYTAGRGERLLRVG